MNAGNVTMVSADRERFKTIHSIIVMDLKVCNITLGYSLALPRIFFSF